MKGIFDLKIPFSFSLNTKITGDKCDRLAYNEDVETIPHLTAVKSALFLRRYGIVTIKINKEISQ